MWMLYRRKCDSSDWEIAPPDMQHGELEAGWEYAILPP